MDIQERLAFEKSLQKRHKNILRWVMWVESIQNYVMNPKTEKHDDVYADKAYRKIQDFLYAWQAAKAQAVPEGFVLVPKEPTDKTITHTINTPIEVNLLCDHADVFLSEGEAYIAYQAMIEAQEPAND